jgi:hypothetical protein
MDVRSVRKGRLARKGNLFFFESKILPFREIGFGTYLYRNIFHLSGDPAGQV